jgi:hypothetical protein
MVIFKCRSLNKEMNDCLHEQTNETAFEAYKAKRALEIESGVEKK